MYHHARRHLFSYKFAIEGIFYCFKNETNFILHTASALLAIILGFFVQLSRIDWILLTGVITFVLVLEMINTVFEVLVDHLWQEEHPRAKIIKDVAAGCVLIGAIGAAITGVLIFGPYFVHAR